MIKKLLLFLIILSLFLLKPSFTFASQKHIEINLTAQKLYAYDGTILVYNFLISSGKWAPTPTGNFSIYWKVPSIRMTGGDKILGTYYDLPNVPYDMFFYQGYALHGTYWHSNFGHPMSHGCINMRTDQATLLYNWTDVGTPVNIY